MKTPIEKLSVDINVSEKNSQTFVTLTSLDVPKRRDSFFEIKLNNSSSVIRIQKNLKKHVDLRKIKVYITQASLDFTNPLHVSWAIFITVFKIENESKLTIKDIRMNIDKPMIAYYLLKNSNLEQIQSKITFTNKSYLLKQINRDILTNESFEKYKLLRQAVLIEIKYLLLKKNDSKTRKIPKKSELTKFSLVIPTLAKNYEYLDQCLNTIYQSSFLPSEIIFIVPNKADFMPHIHKFKMLSIPIRVVQGNKKGIGQARLTGSLAAKFDYVAYVDDDDKVDPAFFSRLVKALDSNESISAMGCWLQSFGFASHILPQFDNLQHIGLINCSPSAGILMWRKNDLIALGGHDPNFRNGYEDFDLTVRTLAAGKTIKVLDVPLYMYRRHIGSTTMKYTEELEQDYRTKIMEKTIKSSPESATVLAQILFSNSWTIRDENPFYWKPSRQLPQLPRHQILLSVYHRFPLLIRRRIYKFMKDL